MRLLVVTQVVDTSSLTLGFFHRWLEKMSAHFESIEVICLFEGQHALPENITVHSLGKEQGARSKGAYALSFLTTIWKLRTRYDAVFVHMNEEYVLLGAGMWRLLGKKIYLWRNHYAGSWRTKLAGMFSDAVFYTSLHSYTARFRNGIQMPVGVDVERFPGRSDIRTERSILFFGRFASSKHPDTFIEALGLLKKRGVKFTASVYGSALPHDSEYRAQVIARAKELDLHEVSFFEGVPHEQAARVFSRHALYVNLARSGMLDKMIFEAAASGAMVLARSEDWRRLVGDEYALLDDSPRTLADQIERMLNLEPKPLTHVVGEQSLEVLIPKLSRVMGVA